MRILYLTPTLPVPPDQGAKLRTLALMRAAAAHHDVDLLSFHSAPAADPDCDADDPDVGELRRICRQVRVVSAPAPRGLPRRALALLTDPLPDLAHRLESHAYAEALHDVLSETQYDLVQIEGLEMIPYLPVVAAYAPRAAAVFDAHNAEMWLQRTMWQADLRDPLRWPAAMYSLVQWSKLGSYERIMLNQTTMVLAVSEIDAGKLRGRHIDPQLVPNGVDTAAIPFHEPQEQAEGTLLFAGSLAYRPNADAVRWLVRRVLPEVRKRVPSARLRLVGSGVERIHNDAVDAVGYVEDVGPELARADVAVIPMRMGSGVRFKALEAMAAGVPVVSTPLGISGIAVEYERHALVASASGAFASAVVRVLEDRGLARQLAQQARRLVEARYDWARITPGYLRLLTTARRARRQRGD